MSTFLFDDFEKLSPAAWKQKIQVDLKGADYNDTLLWKTNEGIVVKPFYTKEDRTNTSISLPKDGFNICQSIFVDDVSIANKLAIDALQRGANSIQFIATSIFDHLILLKGIKENVTIYYNLKFLDAPFIDKLYEARKNQFFQIDIIGNLARTGNWFSNLKSDISTLKSIIQNKESSLTVDASIYQNAGASIVQELAYALAHTNEYIELYGAEVANKIHYCFSVGGNYFFEIAKLRAFRILHQTLLKEYGVKNSRAHIFTKPSLRNKTIYDYNVNMLRTTSECMSAILGGSDTIANVSYDTLYHKSNEFGERIARNQLLILQKEAYLEKVQHIADGAYYVESVTKQLAEKALLIFKQIEKGGGFLKQLKEGIIQKKIQENEKKEQELFNQEKFVLLGTNYLPNKEDRMKGNLEIYPFMKQNNTKTLIPPISPRRLSEHYEQRRLETELL
ncbi:methylmalonyl-CoA mutase subunit beta [Pseudotenacibaculum sp. MALMAid0570]|uniref:methylmalonyl-CoA mutase subunit beta n=1 Tax=Pseudotenacibaculum sp. MALMAid0570 TaxID=3143938 RepID=UPI0032DF4080